MKSQPTSARPRSQDGSHWYYPDGSPCYELPKVDGSGMKVPTLADARKLNLKPSVTTILKILAKPALENWKIEQAVLAVITTPRKPDEKDDEYIERVLNVEKVQDQERDKAAKRGTAIHNALEEMFTGRELTDKSVYPFVKEPFDAICKTGQLVATEKCLVGPDYAGRTDLIMEAPDYWIVRDYKSAKTLPDPKQGAWPEHRLQLSAYAHLFLDALPDTERRRRIVCSNVYISSIIPGQFVICETEDWFETYERGFVPLINYWQFANRYAPQTPKPAQTENSPRPAQGDLLR